jgi:predicted choloylglycine hydrolase
MGPAPFPARLFAGHARCRCCGCRRQPRSAADPNYDYGLDLFERVVYSSAFTGRRVLGTSDCLWGLLDGMNDAGLGVSLAFGGRPGSSPASAFRSSFATSWKLPRRSAMWLRCCAAYRSI